MVDFIGECEVVVGTWAFLLGLGWSGPVSRMSQGRDTYV
jgi:hypothetical protein